MLSDWGYYKAFQTQCWTGIHLPAKHPSWHLTTENSDTIVCVPVNRFYCFSTSWVVPLWERSLVAWLPNSLFLTVAPPLSGSSTSRSCNNSLTWRRAILSRTLSGRPTTTTDRCAASATGRCLCRGNRSVSHMCHCVPLQRLPQRPRVVYCRTNTAYTSPPAQCFSELICCFICHTFSLGCILVGVKLFFVYVIRLSCFRVEFLLVTFQIVLFSVSFEFQVLFSLYRDSIIKCFHSTRMCCHIIRMCCHSTGMCCHSIRMCCYSIRTSNMRYDVTCNVLHSERGSVIYDCLVIYLLQLSMLWMCVRVNACVFVHFNVIFQFAKWNIVSTGWSNVFLLLTTPNTSYRMMFLWSLDNGAVYSNGKHVYTFNKNGYNVYKFSMCFI